MCLFLKFILGIKLYMYRTVPVPIIRKFSLYTQQWYMSYRFADSLRTGSGLKFLTMDRETVRNTWSFIPKISLRNKRI